jgi:hypothetical protein
MVMPVLVRPGFSVECFRLKSNLLLTQNRAGSALLRGAELVAGLSKTGHYLGTI